jgi:hypothetical protein
LFFVVEAGKVMNGGVGDYQMEIKLEKAKQLIN